MRRKKLEKELARNKMLNELSTLRSENSALQSRTKQLLKRHGIWHFAAGDRILYEKLEYLREKVRGRSEERKRLNKIIEDVMPYGSLAILASFNVRHLSHRSSDYKLKQGIEIAAGFI